MTSRWIASFGVALSIGTGAVSCARERAVALYYEAPPITVVASRAAASREAQATLSGLAPSNELTQAVARSPVCSKEPELSWRTNER